MRFQAEKICDALQEAKPLLHAHWREIAHYQDIELNPDYEKYLEMERQGYTRSFSARDESGNLCGYAVYFLKHNLHYKDSLNALQDIVYISPAKRGMGGIFIRFCDEELKKEGVQIVYQHVKAAHNFGPLLERIGYTLQDLIYSRRLDE